MGNNIEWKIEGMSCTNCARSVEKCLKARKVQNVYVNFMDGSLRFDEPANTTLHDLKKEIKQLGFTVITGEAETAAQTPKKLFKSPLQRFLFCLIFTLPLWLHMFIHVRTLMNEWLQLALTIPVFLAGMFYFGRSGWRSLQKGVPNMNVLISIGAIASFIYSLYGTLTGRPENFMFYETTATIITLVFMGNWLESRSVQQTQVVLNSLIVSQKITANMLVYGDNHEEIIFPVDSNSLKAGDLILIKSGEYVPMDCKILSGSVDVNESILTGESMPVTKSVNDYLIGGSTIADGNTKAYVTATGKDTILSRILQMVKEAQANKPPMQQLADKISAVFVPAVLAIALLCFLGNYFWGNFSFSVSLLRSVAVLVIACPCAMGLATPAAIALGLGRAAKHGILFKDARNLEVFKNIRQVVFDKTGTLTTGDFSINGFSVEGNISADEFKRIIFSMEKFSNHPIAKTITKNWKTKNAIIWKKVTEIKGEGLCAEDKEGNIFRVTSYKRAAKLTKDSIHNIYLLKNDELLGWVDVQDTLRPEAKEIVRHLQANGMKIILLSGDTEKKCATIAQQLNIDEFYAGQTPEQKLQKITGLNRIMPTAMVGDGINDAAALAKATVGISLSDASQIAMQSAGVVLMNDGLKNLPLAMGMGKHTYITIQQNLFWAFAYNIIAIPVACFGWLGPSIAALAMGLSDVVLGINSIRLRWKKVTR